MEKETIELYNNGYSITKISQLFNVSASKIRRLLELNNIKILNISDSMIKYYKNNPDKHPWKKNDKFVSRPCENFKKILRENKISYIEEYSNFEEHSYSIDVALPEYKIGFEINGNQHYNKDGSLKDYYIKRDDYITGNGWKLYQLHYSLSYKKDIIIEIVKQSINNNKVIFEFDYHEYLINKLNKTPKIVKYTCECGELMSKEGKTCLKCHNIKQRKAQRPSHDTLKLEIKKLGYVGTGIKYGVSDNSIRKWLKYYNNNMVI